ncbi:MAG: ribose 5-phosphate isomerase [Chthoniobacter sp.]|jgi:ribose 5-phosphate isomerase B|nr:ribose 5-phosphate isomerase [Chthoniobacter sp.]
MRIAIGSDHAGFEYKVRIIEMLISDGHEVRDFGTHSADPVDYPLFIAPTAEAVSRGECERGIVLGGSGNGEAIVANKIRGIRCALCWSVETARLARQHNDANVISLGQRTLAPELALEIVRVWLGAAFEGGRHAGRISEIGVIEASAAAGAPGGFPTHEKTVLIRPEFLNQRGSLFGGYMMQWADDLAFSAASLTFPQATFVTRRFDAFDFTTPVHNGDIVKLHSRVLRTGTSSCVVSVWGVNARSRESVFSTLAVMVHIAPDGQKAPIPL